MLKIIKLYNVLAFKKNRNNSEDVGFGFSDDSEKLAKKLEKLKKISKF